MEAGNRCFDQRVPEELNRKVLDHLSDINMVLTEHARRYLIAEGIRPETIIKTGSHMQEVLEEAGLSLDSVDAYCLHQGSGAIVDAIAKRLGENGDRVVKDMFGAGNTVSSTIPLLMERYAFEDSAWQNLVMSGFGVGLSWGSAVLFRR